MHDKYPDIDELLRQLPNESASHITEVQRKISPSLWRLFRGVKDEGDQFMDAHQVYRIAYDVAVELIRDDCSKESMLLPDIASLAKGEHLINRRT